MKARTKILLVLLLLIVTNGATAILVVKTQGAEAQELVQLGHLEDLIRKNYLRDVTDEEFFEGQLKGTVAALNDPYSVYFNADEMEDFVTSATGQFVGIGVQVAPGEDGLIEIIAPIKGSPAEEAGLRAGDRIIAVDGKDYQGSELEEAVKVIRGEEGTTVLLKLLSQGKVKEVEVTREQITVDSVFPEDIDPEVGYIAISQFEEHTGKDFREALSQVVAAGKKGLILDLRGNPGGMLDSGVEVSDALLGKANIVSAKDHDGQEVFRYDSDEDRAPLNLVVLINGASASASEIVAGAIQDNGAGILVGETSFGKGVVQTLLPLPGGAGLKLTTSEYFTPSGVNIQDKGIEPDVVVALPEETQGIGVEHLEEDLQLQRALEILKDPETQF
ncbi:MAG: S41 family peptidase [Tissierellia bacterium]|nr:S41 family peptidase [Tissierellia bacterium]